MQKFLFLKLVILKLNTLQPDTEGKPQILHMNFNVFVTGSIMQPLKMVV